MIFWIILAGLTGALLAWTVWPLLRAKPDDATRAAYDAAVYYDQLQELERDRTRGLIDDGQAEAARIEIERRLLAAGRAAGLTGRAGGRRHLALAAAVALAVPLVALSLYLELGSPGQPGEPFAGRDAAPAEPSGLVAEARARLDAVRARIEADPQDAQAWFDLGRLHLVSGDLAGASVALARARALAPERTEIASAQGEALARLAEGMVTAEARAAFATALAGNPADPRARYFLALADYQAGREQAALESWAALAGDAPPDAAWLPTVLARVRDTAHDLGHDPADWLPARSAAPGPSEADIAAAQDLDPEARQQMIRGMVDRLAARLVDEPDDVDGWRQLGRSREVLGEPAAAAVAYGRALELAPGHPETLLRAALTSAQAGDTERARALFIALRDRLPPDADAHRIVSEAIERLEAAGR
jgi:cytochrome c-type biogenesis protein CcmH